VGNSFETRNRVTFQKRAGLLFYPADGGSTFLGTHLTYHMVPISENSNLGSHYCKNQISQRTDFHMLYSIHYGNEGASSSVSDVDGYVITRKLLDYTTLTDILHPLWERGCVIVSDVGRCAIIRKSQVSIFKILPVFRGRREIQTYSRGSLLPQSCLHNYDVPWFVKTKFISAALHKPWFSASRHIQCQSYHLWVKFTVRQCRYH
jgi:hypothetical protein